MQVDAELNGGYASFQIQEGGVFVARTGGKDIGMIVGVTILCLALLAIVIGTVVYFKRHPGKWTAVSTSCRNAERSLHSKV